MTDRNSGYVADNRNAGAKFARDNPGRPKANKPDKSGKPAPRAQASTGIEITGTGKGQMAAAKCGIALTDMFGTNNPDLAQALLTQSLNTLSVGSCRGQTTR